MAVHKIISSGSKGNSVIYHGSIMVDIGLSYKAIKPYIQDVGIVLLTHQHSDHLNISTLKRLQFERPSLRIGACQWMMKYLKGLKHIDLYEANKVYEYGPISISPVPVQHDVPNCGYRIIYNNHKTFHVTDVAHLDGIEAKDYDLYAIEFNYDADQLDSTIIEAHRRGVFTHVTRSSQNHLSIQQAVEFIYRNKKTDSEIVKLHQSESF